MSAFDPWQQPPAPPVDPRPHTTRPGSHPLWRRAAIFCWVTGAVGFGFFGCCTASMFLMTAAPFSYVQSGPYAAQLQEAGIQNADQWRLMLIGTGIVLMLLINLPGLALIALGFGVRRGIAWARIAAMVITAAQGVLLGLYCFGSAVFALINGDVLGLIMAVVLFSPLPVLAIYTFIVLLRAAGAGRQAAYINDHEPWNSHLG